LDNTQGQDMDSTFATAEWNDDSVHIKNPAGQKLLDRIRLVFELGIASNRLNHPGMYVGMFGTASVSVNDKSMTMSYGPDVQLIDSYGNSNPFPYSFNSSLKTGERVVARPGSSLANLIDGDLSYPIDPGQSYNPNSEATEFDQPYNPYGNLSAIRS